MIAAPIDSPIAVVPANTPVLAAIASPLPVATVFAIVAVVLFAKAFVISVAIAAMSTPGPAVPLNIDVKTFTAFVSVCGIAAICPGKAMMVDGKLYKNFAIPASDASVLNPPNTPPSLAPAAAPEPAPRMFIVDVPPLPSEKIILKTSWITI